MSNVRHEIATNATGVSSLKLGDAGSILKQAGKGIESGARPFKAQAAKNRAAAAKASGANAKAVAKATTRLTKTKADLTNARKRVTTIKNKIKALPAPESPMQIAPASYTPKPGETVRTEFPSAVGHSPMNPNISNAQYKTRFDLSSGLTSAEASTD
jgi:hypothetical protein